MVNKWELKGKIGSSNYRKKVLLKLSEGVFTPKQLEKALNIKLSHISRTLTELEKMKLIECLNPTLRKGKMFKITQLGKQILKE